MNPYLQRAQMLYQRSRYADAERELGMALTQDPNDAWVYALFGACRAAQDDFAKADELARQAMALAPDSADIRHLVARIQLQRNDLSQALKIATEAIQLNPHDARFYATRAMVHAQRKNWKAALADSESALEIDPENLEAINVRSLARRSTGDMQSAAAELQHALEVNPEDAHSHANLGWTHLQNGQLDKAQTHFREALRLDPDLDWARVGVIETLKARVPFYRWILNYFLWMQTKAAGAQWAIIIGLYIAYRLVSGIAEQNPALAPFLTPLLIVYLLFVVATWFAKPLADAALLAHPFGRLALTKQEKREGLTVAGLIASALGLYVAGSVIDSGELLQDLAFVIGISGLPWAMCFNLQHPKAKRIMQLGALVLTCVGGLLAIDMLTDLPNQLLAPEVYQSVFQLLFTIFIYSPLATIIGANLLSQQEWRN